MHFVSISLVKLIGCENRMFNTYDHFIGQAHVKELSGIHTSSRYPIKLMRYWIAGNLLIEEGNPNELAVAEIGIDRGQMKSWMDHLGASGFRMWDGYDVEVTAEAEDVGYDNLFEGDATSSDWRLRKEYDVVVLLHFLEHLANPSDFFAKIACSLPSGGVVIGGMPGSPEFMREYWQKKLRKEAKPFGHQSVFSCQRIKAMANEYDMNVDFMSGGHLVRWDNSKLESSKFWLGLNAWVASRVKGFGNDLYFKLKKR